MNNDMVCIANETNSSCIDNIFKTELQMFHDINNNGKTAKVIPTSHLLRLLENEQYNNHHLPLY